MIEKYLALMERNNLLAFSQNPTTGLYRASKKLCPQLHAIFLRYTYDSLVHVSISQTLTSLEVFGVKPPIFDIQRTVQTVNITSMTNTNCCEYSIKTPDDGQYICPKHVEFFTKIS
jgi:hypothetical protein